MGKRVRVKPSKGQSLMGFVVGIIFCLIGFFIVIPTFGLFGLFWAAIAVAITAISGINAFSEKGVATHEIYINDIDDEDSFINYSKSDTEKRLEELKSLYDKGIITSEEYQEKRRKIIDNI